MKVINVGRIVWTATAAPLGCRRWILLRDRVSRRQHAGTGHSLAKRVSRSIERRTRPDGLSVDECETRKQKLVFARFDDIMDVEPAVRHLADPGAASEVERSLRHFCRGNVTTYSRLWSCQVIFTGCFTRERIGYETVYEEERQAGKHAPRTPRARIMKSVKGYSANECNRLLGLRGEFWQDESYDHVVRDNDSCTASSST